MQLQDYKKLEEFRKETKKLVGEVRFLVTENVRLKTANANLQNGNITGGAVNRLKVENTELTDENLLLTAKIATRLSARLDRALGSSRSRPGYTTD